MSQSAMIQEIIVNGAAQPWSAQTVRALLAVQGIDPAQPGIAVAINASVIPRGEWEYTLVQPGDRVEIVRATAGG